MDPGVAPPIASPLGAIDTERLHLRPFALEDLDDLAAVFAEPAVWQYPYGRGLHRAETRRFLDAQLEHWALLGFGCWLAESLELERAVGYVGLSVPTFLPEVLPAVEVGWRFDPAVWGRGLASEGARAALAEGFTTLGLQEICSLPQSANPRSVQVCERLGMRFDRTVTCPATDRRGAVDAHLYVLGAAEWEREQHR